MRVATLTLLACLLVACRTTSQMARPAPTLQKYDGLTRSLHGLSTRAAQLPEYVTRLQAAMNAQDSGATRNRAVDLRARSLEFRAMAGRIGNNVRLLGQLESDWRVRTYLHWVLHALTNQWHEGDTLNSEAQNIWHDPLQVVGRNVQRLRRFDTDARWYAWQSVLWARAAADWKDAHRTAFRYIPVHPPVPQH